jgi:multidrug efflux pump subunit AcrA (membrane-fusion protein)
MTNRQILILIAGVAILAGSIVTSRFLKKEKDADESKSESITAVKTLEVNPGLIHREVTITGRLVPEKTIMLFAEVGGKASKGSKSFKEGVRFNKGEVIIQINSEEIESSVISSRSNFQSLLASVIPDLKLDFPDIAKEWEDYLFSIEIEESLPPLPEVNDKKLKLFLSGRQIFSNYYKIKEQETRLDKYIIRAPFNGSLVSANLDESTLVRVGQPIGEFISTGSYELEAGISYLDAEFLAVGTEFEMKDVNTGNTYEAKVIRVNDRVDPSTQQVKIYASIKDPSAKSGIYLEGQIQAQNFENAVRIPVSSLVNGNNVFVVQDSIANLKQVNLEFKNNEIAILTGLDGKSKVIIGKHNESLNGLKVSEVNLAE